MRVVGRVPVYPEDARKTSLQTNIGKVVEATPREDEFYDGEGLIYTRLVSINV